MSNSSGGLPIGASVQQDAYLRVKAAKVTQLLDLVGELGLAAAEVTQHPKLVELELEGFEISVHRLENLIRELQDLASSLRLVPVGTVFRRMQRLVRDLSHQTGKPIDLETIRRLAELPGREELLSQILSVMKGVPTSLARVFNTILVNLLNALKAIEASKENESGKAK